MGHTGIIKVGLMICLLADQLALGCAKAPGVEMSAAAVTAATVGRDVRVHPAPKPRPDTPVVHPDTPVTPFDTARYPHYLALGDSYTIGQSVTVADRYPVQTAAFLAIQGDTINAPEIIATTGWTTADLLNALQNTPPKLSKYSRVTLLIGVNNEYQGRPLSEYQTQFTQLLQQSIHLAGDTPRHVIVLSIPDWGDSFYGQAQPNPAAVSASIDTFNNANLAISQQYGVQYINITTLTRQAKGDTSLFAVDGLHYSGKEMALWAQLLVQDWPAK